MTAPSAAGTLAETPLAHALIYARNRRLSGRIELSSDDQRRAIISLWSGRITSVQTLPVSMWPGAYFGAIVYELGYIDAPTLDSSLLEISRTKRLHGEVLLERQAITEAQRDEALVEQIHRKVHNLFALGDTTVYAFYDVATAPTNVAVDPVGPVWRGIREHVPTRFVEETIGRVGDKALRVTAGGSARLPPAETALAEALARKPMTLSEMKASTELPAAHVDLLVYLLVIARCVESVSGARTYPSTGALPTSMPSGPVRAPSGIPGRGSGPIAVKVPQEVLEAMRSVTPRPMTGPNAATLPAMARTSPPGVPAVTASRPPPGTLAALQSPADLGIEAIVTRAASVEDETLFHVLGVVDNASAEAVRAAYVRLAKTWHPDRLPSELAAVKGEVAKIFSQMSHAHRTLCDPDARRTYEAKRKASTGAKIRPREEILGTVSAAMARRDFPRATELAQQLLDRDSGDSEAIALHAWASVRGGEATEDELKVALLTMDRAVNADRTCDQAVYHRGLVHKRLGNIPSAFRDFARAMQINPSHVDAEREVRILAMRARKLGSGEHVAIPRNKK